MTRERRRARASRSDPSLGWFRRDMAILPYVVRVGPDGFQVACLAREKGTRAPGLSESASRIASRGGPAFDPSRPRYFIDRSHRAFATSAVSNAAEVGHCAIDGWRSAASAWTFAGVVDRWRRSDRRTRTSEPRGDPWAALLGDDGDRPIRGREVDFVPAPAAPAFPSSGTASTCGSVRWKDATQRSVPQ